VSKYKAGDLVTFKIDEDDASNFNDGNDAWIYISQIVKHEPAPFDWADVKPGMAFEYDGGIEYFIGWHPKIDTPVITDGCGSNTLGMSYKNLRLTRAPEHDIEVKE
jgi:hypothetical protein